MEIGTISLLDQLWRSFLQFYQSPFVFGVKIFLAIYVAVLIVDIVLIIALHTPTMYFRVIRSGANVPAPVKSKLKKRWEKIESRLATDNISQYKVAILEADKLADETLESVGYKGNNMGERLEHIMPEQLEMVEELKSAHAIRNEIVYKADFVLDMKQAKETIAIYRKLLEMLEFI